MTRRCYLATALCTMIIALLGACGKSTAEEALDLQVENTREEVSEGKPENRDVITDSSIDYAVALMVTINPEALFYLDDDKNVLKIEALNTDCEDVLENMTMKEGHFADCYGDYLEICRRQGYMKTDSKQEVKLTVVDKGELISVDYCEDVVGNAEEIVGEMGKLYHMDLYAVTDTSVLDPARTNENHNDISADDGVQSDDAIPSDDDTCDNCGGVGSIPCDNCSGSGTEIVVEHYVNEVRNDYVCPICGGKGWVDDGMHGGETAECGNCTKDGGSGDFRPLAYDLVEVDEEVEYPCHRCNGSGNETCYRCNGSGHR